MRKLQLLTAMAIGISTTAIGAIQVEAATYNYFVDFSTKEVANFNDYTQVFYTDTYNLDSLINFKWSGSYKYDSCPTPFVTNLTWETYYQINGVGPEIVLKNSTLPEMPCTTVSTPYLAEASTSLPSIVVDMIMNDDTNFVNLRSYMVFSRSVANTNRTLTLSGYRNYFDITYDFNTTYLFNKFLSDQNWIQRTAIAGTGGLWNFTSTRNTYLQYVYTTAGNDEYYILNTNVSDIGTTRKKYAIDYNDEFFRGESIGAQFTIDYTGSDTHTMGTSNAILGYQFRYYYLNAANNQQAIVDAPEFNFTYEDCGWDVFDIPCFINNGLAYITNDAPIISDAITLLNAGIAMAAQTFGIIGAFSTDNVFGYLILAGFGYLAVRWFLKND